MKKNYLEFDPRTQLAVLLLASVVVLFSQLPAVYLLVGFMFGYLTIQGMVKQALKNMLVLLVVVAIQQGIMLVTVEWLSAFGFLAFLILRFLPVTMAASCLVRTSTGKLMTALQTIGIPLQLIIGLAVVFRFMPVFINEFRAIQVSAKQRGFGIMRVANWLQPVQLAEITLVPLLMRSLRIAEELGASAMTKGIEKPGIKTSLYSIKFTWIDSVFLVFYSCWLVFVLGYGGAI